MKIFNRCIILVAIYVTMSFKSYGQDFVAENPGADVYTYILLSVCLVAVCVFVYLFRKMYGSLTEARNSNNSQYEHLMLAMNAGGLTAWGYDVASHTVHDIYGNKPFDGVSMDKMIAYIHHDDTPKFRQALEDLSKGTKTELNLHIRVLHPRSGEYLLVECDMKPVKDGKGNVIEVMSVQKNVTEKVKLEQERSELIKKFSQIFNNNAVGISVYDKNGFLIDVNQEACRMVGIKNRDEILEFRPSLADNPNITEADRCRILNGERFSFVETINFAKVKLYNSYQSERYDTAIIERHTSPMLSSTGDFHGTIISSIDITEKVELEQRLQYFVHEQDILFKAFPTGIAVFDQKGSLTRANNSFCSILGITEVKFPVNMHKDMLSLFNVPKDLEDKVKTGDMVEYKTTLNYDNFKDLTGIEKADFNDKWLSVHIRSINKDDRVWSYIISIEDITEFYVNNIRLERERMMNDVTAELCNLIKWSYYSDTKKFVVRFDADRKLEMNRANFGKYISEDTLNSFYRFLLKLDNKVPGIHKVLIDADFNEIGEFGTYELRGGIRPTGQCDEGIKSAGYMHDSTELQRALEQLESEREINKLLQDNSDSMLVYVSKDGKILWENVSSRFSLADTGSSLFPVGEFCYNTHSAYKYACGKCLIYSTVNDKKSHIETKTLYNGHEVRLESAPVFNNKGSVKGVTIKVTDITGREWR